MDSDSAGARELFVVVVPGMREGVLAMLAGRRTADTRADPAAGMLAHWVGRVAARCRRFELGAAVVATGGRRLASRLMVSSLLGADVAAVLLGTAADTHWMVSCPRG